MSVLFKLKQKLKKPAVRKWFIFLLTIILLPLCVLLYLDSGSNENVNISSEETAKILVKVQRVSPGSYQSIIHLLGEVTPEWESVLKMQVEGKITWVSDHFRAGNFVAKGTVLALVDNSQYKQGLAQAQMELSQANLNLLTEQRESEEAYENWQNSGIEGTEPSPLLLRQPQLRVALDQVKAAEANLVQANKLLEYTSVTAPFDALIVDRNISVGDSVFSGDEVGSLYGTDKALVTVHLDGKQWSLLGDECRGRHVVLKDPQTDASWIAQVAREAHMLSEDSRLRSLYIELDHPFQQQPALLPGSFLSVAIDGKYIPHLLQVPESSVTKSGLLWYVDSNDSLRSFSAIPLFYEKGMAYVPVPKSLLSVDSFRISLSPNTSFVNGLPVNPVTNK